MRMIFSLMDADGDGKLTLQEFQAAHERIFKAMDTDHDGTVTLEEMEVDGHQTPKTVVHSTSPEKNRSLTRRTRSHSPAHATTMFFRISSAMLVRESRSSSAIRHDCGICPGCDSVRVAGSDRSSEVYSVRYVSPRGSALIQINEPQ
jgi:hypothetical protein